MSLQGRSTTKKARPRQALPRPAPRQETPSKSDLSERSRAFPMKRDRTQLRRFPAFMIEQKKQSPPSMGQRDVLFYIGEIVGPALAGPEDRPSNCRRS